MNRCRCCNIPAESDFQIDSEYQWEYIIDGIIVINEKGKKIFFDEYTFLRYFTKL